MTTMISIRLTDYDLACLDSLAAVLGTNRTNVLRLGYAALAKAEKVQLPTRKEVAARKKISGKIPKTP